MFSVVYASTSRKSRRILRGELKEIEYLNIPHIITVDFDCVFGPKFKKGDKSFDWGRANSISLNLRMNVD